MNLGTGDVIVQGDIIFRAFREEVNHSCLQGITVPQIQLS